MIEVLEVGVAGVDLAQIQEPPGVLHARTVVRPECVGDGVDVLRDLGVVDLGRNGPVDEDLANGLGGIGAGQHPAVGVDLCVT